MDLYFVGEYGQRLEISVSDIRRGGVIEDDSTPHTAYVYLDYVSNFDRVSFDRSELAWWREFGLKITHDSQMPRVGSPLIGNRFSVTKEGI